MLMRGQTSYDTNDKYSQHTEKNMIPCLEHLMTFGRNGKGYCWLIRNALGLIVDKVVDGGEWVRMISIVDGSFTKRAYEIIVMVTGRFLSHGSDVKKEMMD